MLRILFLLLILMSSVVFSQTMENKGQKETAQAYIFAEIGKANNLQVKKLFLEYDDILIKKFEKGLDYQGYIISYGTDKAVVRREKQIRDSYTFRRYDTYRLTFVRGGISSKLKTVFWIIPEGAKLPKP
jgi:aspartyl-tRNA synthetase